MRVKIFSVRADEDFSAIRIGEQTRQSSANEKLELDIQAFLDENPNARIVHIQFSSVAIVPRNASWGTTNTDIEWEIEKSVLVVFDEDHLANQDH